MKLFEESLKKQAPGTLLDIKKCKGDATMAVPFWTWHNRQSEVLEILQNYVEEKDLLFVWDLLKNKIEQCTCLFSGKRVEIVPRLLPIELIPSFAEAKRRILLSATLTEDSILIRDLGIDSESISKPLSCEEVTYCGERLIIMPSLIDINLRREATIGWISKFASKHGNFGVVSIVPSNNHSNEWKRHDAIVTKVQNLQQNIEDFRGKVRQNNAKRVLVLVNEYDGVDLPDGTCRILCLDSLPSYKLLIDKYAQEVRPNSKLLRRQLAQRVEQGIGRGIRGSSDWCIVVIISTNLTNFLSKNVKRLYLSYAAQNKITIAEELTEHIKNEDDSILEIEKLMSQCLYREDAWKKYYKDRMTTVQRGEINKEYLKLAVLERKAEISYQKGHIAKAIETINELINMSDEADKGWFMQLIATYLYPTDKTKSMDMQLKAQTENTCLFRPDTGVSYSRCANTSNRVSRILDEINNHNAYNSLIVHVEDIMEQLTFNTPFKLFEKNVDRLGSLLGFATDTPEQKTGNGPDNLWGISGKNYWIIECKNEVSLDREGISKKEIGQMIDSIGWFRENYEEHNGTPIIIHPSNIVSKGANPTEDIWVIQEESLNNLKKQVIMFYNSLRSTSFDSLTTEIIKQKLRDSSLDNNNLKKYLCRAKKHNL